MTVTSIFILQSAFYANIVKETNICFSEIKSYLVLYLTDLILPSQRQMHLAAPSDGRPSLTPPLNPPAAPPVLLAASVRITVVPFVCVTWFVFTGFHRPGLHRLAAACRFHLSINL